MSGGTAGLWVSRGEEATLGLGTLGNLSCPTLGGLVPRPVYQPINREQWAFTWKVYPVLGLRQDGHNENHWFEVAMGGGE